MVCRCQTGENKSVGKNPINIVAIALRGYVVAASGLNTNKKHF